MLAFAGGYPCCCQRSRGSTSSEPPGSSATSTSSVSLGTTVCGICQGAVTSQYYRVDLAGIATGTGLCLGGRTCANLDGSYVLGPLAELTVEGNTYCQAGLEIAGVCRDDDSCFALLRLVFERPLVGDLAGHYLVYVELSSTGECNEDTGEPIMTFLHDFGSDGPPDCLGSFPLIISGGVVEFVITPKCAAGGATCTITAIAPP
ncbi:MAG: hypothetical protein KF708_02510 [Pirellulales bacterium]|nr:hypothetical protein [Pirellulales bacterium]